MSSPSLSPVITLPDPHRLVSTHNLTSVIEKCKTLYELRQIARDHKAELNAVHDSVICIVAGRLGVGVENDNNGCLSQAIAIYSIALRNWLNRRFGSKGRDARSCAYIMYAGAKLGISVNSSLFTGLCDEALLMEKEFNEEQLANCLSSIATLGVVSASKPLVMALISRCKEMVTKFDSNYISICIWSVATLGTDVTGDSIVSSLISRCILVARDLDAKNVSKCLRSIAILGINLTGEEIIPVLISKCIKEANNFTSQMIANCLWSVATIGVKITEEAVIPVLINRCKDVVGELNALEIANCLWSFATLNISNKEIIRKLLDVCKERVGEMNPHSLSNCIISAASLGEELIEEEVLEALLKACMVIGRQFNTNELVNTLRALSTLRVSDVIVVRELSRACIVRVDELNSRQSAMCFLAVAAFGIEIIEPDVILVIINACIKHSQEFNDQKIATCFWSLASLYEPFAENKQYQELSSVLVLAVETHYLSMTRLDQANQCLQAHFCGLTLSDSAIKHFNVIFQKSPQTTSITASQEAIAAVLTHLGYLVQQEVPIFGGIVTVDIVIKRSSVTKGALASSMPRTKDIAIEFDGPWHYMRKEKGNLNRVGPIDVRTRLRNILVKKSGIFEKLVVIPFYEWDEKAKWQAKKKDSSDDGREEKQGGLVIEAQTLGMAYLTEKIASVTIHNKGS